MGFLEGRFDFSGVFWETEDADFHSLRDFELVFGDGAELIGIEWENEGAMVTKIGEMTGGVNAVTAVVAFAAEDEDVFSVALLVWATVWSGFARADFFRR